MPLPAPISLGKRAPSTRKGAKKWERSVLTLGDRVLAAYRLDSEQFRSFPRTYRPFCGKLYWEEVRMVGGAVASPIE
jgi:hypothetical protein